MFRYLTHALLALLLLAASCTPTYLLGVQPIRPQAGPTGSPPYAEAATPDSVRLALRFAGYEPGWLVFEAEYHNNSPQAVLIDPAGFAQVPLRQAEALPTTHLHVRRGEPVPAAVAAATQRTPWPALPPTPLPALDPAASAEHLQDAADIEAAKARRPDWLGLALLAVSIGTDVASTTRRYESRTQYQTRALLHEAAWTYNAVSGTNRAHHAYTADQLARQAAHLRQYGLQRGSLAPGQQVRGYVYLPRFDEADQLRVLAPLGKQQVALDFAQLHRRR